MSLKLTVHLARIAGTPSKTSWSQAHTFSPEEKEKREKRGTLIACLCFSGQGEGVEAVVAGREILARLHEEFYGQLEDDAFSRLSLAVDKVYKEFSQKEEDLEIVAACILGDVLYLSSKGGGQAWVKRGGFCQKVLVGGKDLERASGFLKENDILLLATSFFFKAIPPRDLKAALETESPQEAVDSLATLVGSQEDSSKTVAVIGKITKEEREIPEELDTNRKIDRNEKDRGRLIGDFPKKLEFLKSFSQEIRKVFKENIYLRQRKSASEERKKKRVIFTVAIFLIILLGISLFFGLKKRSLKNVQEEYSALYQEATRLFEEGEALVSLNPSLSRQQLLASQEKISQLEEFQIEKEKTLELKRKIEEKLKLVTKEKEIKEADVFFDLGLLVAEADGRQLSGRGDSLVVLDKNKNRLLAIDIEKKSGEILAGGENLDEASFLTIYDNSVFVLANKGIFKVSKEGKESLVVERDEAWGEIKAFSSFAGNLYLLDKSDKIWRYSQKDKGYGSGQNWFKQGVSPDLEKAVSMAIDGSIWVLTQEGKILKFTQGVLDAFGIAGLEKPFVEPTALYTSDETENLYVLDRKEKKIVVLAKSGEYQFQYLWEGLGKAQDIFVSEEKGKVFVLEKDKIYEIGLEQ